MNWHLMGKPLMVLGGLVFLVGLAVHLGLNLSFIGRLPGDIRIERPNFVLYLPLTTCLLASLLLSLLAYLIGRLR